MVPIDFFGKERVVILYIFPYLHLGPPFPLSVLFSSIKSNPQQYRVYYNVSNYFARKFIFKNFWISVFYLTMCMNFFTFIFFIYIFFPGVYNWCPDELFLCRNPIKPHLLGFPGICVFAYGLLNRVFKRFTSFDIRAWLY